MGDQSAIEWTDATWNPLLGCSRVSAGCEHCYAERLLHRGLSERHRGLTRTTSRGPVWTGEVRLVPEALDLPLRWYRPRRVFVNSLSDLFHDAVSDVEIAKVLARCAIASWNTFQILTKRAERARDLMGVRAFQLDVRVIAEQVVEERNVRARRRRDELGVDWEWPLPNVHLGVSCEDQDAADERVPLLLQTPAAVRWVSAEPLLGALDLSRWMRGGKIVHVRADVEGMLRHRSFDCLQHDDGRPMTRREAEDALFSLHAKGVKYIPASAECDGFDPQAGCPGHPNPRLDWIVVGGESGPGARPCDVGWIRSIVQQCDAAKVPVFVKQLGAEPRGWCIGSLERMDPDDAVEPDYCDVYEAGEAGGSCTGRCFFLRSRKGSDPAEWPEDLRRRELPEARA